MAFTASSSRRRPVLVLGLVLAVVVAGPAVVAQAAATDPAKVTICHTGNGDELVEITPSVNGVLNGHEGHAGDVIPPFTVNGVTFEGRNWDAAGQATHANGCVAVTPTDPADDPTSDPTDNPTSDPTDDPTGEEPGATQDPGDPNDEPTEDPGPTPSPTTAVLADEDDDAAPVTAVLAETGSNVAPLVALAAGVILAGAAAVAATHRRARRATR